MGDSCDRQGGNRRAFLKTTAATGAVLASTSLDRLHAQEPGTAVPLVSLGKTGQKVPKLGMGTSWDVAPSFVNAALASGVTYIDTSETYERGNAEKVLGDVIERTKKRKDVYLVTKCGTFGRGGGEVDPKVFATQLEASLARLKTDYVDCYYLHGIEGKHLGLLKKPEIKAAFEALKKSGKIKFCGLSCHDAKLPELLEEAAEVGWIDQAMFKYNFHDVDQAKLQRAVDKAKKANMGLIAMKTQGGAAVSFPDKHKGFVEKGFKKEVAAIKTVWADDRIDVVVSEMTNFNELKENIAASNEPLTKKEARLLEEYRHKVANLYCHGCSHLCESAAKGVPVATVLRYLRYYETYGKRERARELYKALPPEARALAGVTFRDAEDACPNGLPLVQLMSKADRLLS